MAAVGLACNTLHVILRSPVARSETRSDDFGASLFRHDGARVHANLAVVYRAVVIR